MGQYITCTSQVGAEEEVTPVHVSQVKSDPSHRKIPSLLVQVTLGKSHNFFETHPSVKWSYAYPTRPQAAVRKPEITPAKPRAQLVAA